MIKYTVNTSINGKGLEKGTEECADNIALKLGLETTVMTMCELTRLVTEEKQTKINTIDTPFKSTETGKTDNKYKCTAVD